MRRWAVPALLTALSTVVALLTSGTSARGAPSTTSRSSPLPLFAYYYQWFDVRSWDRAKIDYPALGRYSSDDRQVMTRHIREAKTAGVTGFIVSWKDTPTDTRRLHSLADVAAREHFSLAMIYQGLDFNRKPLPVVKVAADFKMFAAQFAQDPVFYRMGGKPLTIWSGTWAFSHHDVASVTGAVRPALLVLSTEKSVAGYQRISDVTDGDAYYWSSVNPTTNRTYAAKLRDMSSAVHADGKYWIAPVAPGFDARLVGGTKTVPRGDGATLRTEYNTAMESSPDALGLISWNEFSENTYVEPSERLGRRYLDDAEHPTLGLFLAGERAPRSWETGKAQDFTPFDAKAEAIALLDAAGAPVDNLQIFPDAGPTWHPGRSATARLAHLRPHSARPGTARGTCTCPSSSDSVAPARPASAASIARRAAAGSGVAA